MSELSKHMNCYILAGGKSSRMGMDKGLIELKNKPIIDYVIEAVRPLFKKVFIVSNNLEYSKFGLELIPDLIKEIGPAGGILTAMNHCSTDQFFVVSCDMPFIHSAAVEYLIAEAQEYQITVPVYQTKFEPLFAIYSKSCLEKWKENIQKEMFKLQNIISNFKSKDLNVEGNPLFPEELFTNINTREDLEKAIKKLNHDN